MDFHYGNRKLSKRALLTAVAGGISGCASNLYLQNDSESSKQAEPTSWEMAGKNSKNTSRIDSEMGSKIGEVAWRGSLASEFASPVVTTLRHAIVNTQSRIVGFEKSDGEVAFSKALPGGMAAAPAVTQNHILVPRDTYGEGFDTQINLQSPKLYALDRDSSSISWELSLDGKYLASVAVADDIYVQSDLGTYRIQPDGTVKWRQMFDSSFDWQKTLSYIRPAIGPNGVYIGHRDSLVKLDRESGDVVWTRSMGKTLFPPVIADDSTIIASTRKKTVGLDPSEGHLRWQVSRPPVWTPASNDKIAVLSTTQKLLGINLKTGEQQWIRDMSLSTCPPVIAGDTVFLVPGGMNLVSVGAKNGKRIAKRKSDRMVESITPDANGLLTRQSEDDGSFLRKYQLK